MLISEKVFFKAGMHDRDRMTQKREKKKEEN